MTNAFNAHEGMHIDPSVVMLWFHEAEGLGPNLYHLGISSLLL